MPDMFPERLKDAAFMTPPTLEAVMEAIRRIREHEVDVDEVITYNGEPTAIKDLPSPSRRAEFGMGHWLASNTAQAPLPHPYKAEGHDWPWHPNECRVASWGKDWLWLNGGKNLVCPGCGIEGT